MRSARGSRTEAGAFANGISSRSYGTAEMQSTSSPVFRYALRTMRWSRMMSPPSSYPVWKLIATSRMKSISMNTSMPANVPKLVAPNAILIGVAMHEYRMRMHIKKSHRPLNTDLGWNRTSPFRFASSPWILSVSVPKMFAMRDVLAVNLFPMPPLPVMELCRSRTSLLSSLLVPATSKLASES